MFIELHQTKGTKTFLSLKHEDMHIRISIAKEIPPENPKDGNIVELGKKFSELCVKILGIVDKVKDIF